MAKQFKRPRMLIIGCGDIGQRIIQNSPKFWRFIITNRSGLKFKNNYNSKTAQIQESLIKCYKLDLDNSDNKIMLNKLKKLTKNIIYLAPPQNYGNYDHRIRQIKYIFYSTNINFTYISTTGVYGNQFGNIVDENSILHPISSRAIRRVDAENYLRKLAIKSKNKLFIIRTPGIYAANRLPLERLKQNIPIFTKEDDIYTNHIHAIDLARIIFKSLFSINVPTRIVNAVDNSNIKAGDWLEYLAFSFNLPMPLRLPKQQLMHQIDNKRKSFLSESRRISNKRLKSLLKFSFLYNTIFEGIHY